MPDSPGERPWRLVLDTNVVVSGLLWNGPSRRLLDLAIEAETLALYSTTMLLDELAHTLGYAKLAPRIRTFGVSVDSLVDHYSALVSLVMPASVPRVVIGDADDDHVIAAAVAARADLIVTGDRRHLLPIGSHDGVGIVTPRLAVERIDGHVRPTSTNP